MKLKKAFCGALVVTMAFSNGVLAFADTASVPALAVHEERVIAEEVMPEKYPAEMKKANLTEEEVEGIIKEQVKKIFNLNLEDEGIQSRIEYRPDWNQRDQYVWQMSFYRYNRDGGMDVHVTINDTTKQITSINKYEYNNAMNNMVSKYTRGETEKIAYEFLKKINGDKLDQLVLDNRYYGNVNYGYNYDNGLYPTEYRLYYARKVGDILVADNGVHIGVNSGTGEVTSYSYNWVEGDFQPKGKVISPQEARETFEKNSGFRLNYVPVRDEKMDYEQPPKEIKLAYSPYFEMGSMIDAYTGEIIDYQGLVRTEIKKIDVTDKEKEEFKKLTSNRKIHEKEMNKDQAMEVARKALEVIYKDEVKLESANYIGSQPYSGYGNRKRWDVQFKLDDNQETFGNITVDALTEEVLSIDYYNWRMKDMMMMSGEGFVPQLNWEEAYKQSINILKALYPEKMKSLSLEQVYSGGAIHYYGDKQFRDIEYYFNFQRKENDIPYINNQINISFDNATGQLQSIYFRWDDVEFPKVEKVIDQEKALEIFMNQSNIKLQYVTLHIPKEGSEPERQLKLVYMNQPQDGVFYNFIDAKTGAFLDWNGREIKGQNEKAQSIVEAIKGHNAERELQIMLEKGIIDLQSFTLSSKLPKQEILKMIVMAKGYWPHIAYETGELKFTDIKPEDPYYSYIQGAVYHRLIENENKALKGNETVTREEFAALLVKMANLDKLAQVKGIYTLPVKDAEKVDKNLLGHTALIYGLGIMKDEGGYYRPQDEVTLDQVAVAIYRAFELLGINRY